MEGFIEIEKYQKLQQEFEQLKFQMEQLQRMVFGAKSERFIAGQSPDQLSLFSVEEKRGEQQVVKVGGARKESSPTQAKA